MRNRCRKFVLISKQTFCIRGFIFFPFGEEIRLHNFIVTGIGVRIGKKEGNDKDEKNRKTIFCHDRQNQRWEIIKTDSLFLDQMPFLVKGKAALKAHYRIFGSKRSQN